MPRKKKNRNYYGIDQETAVVSFLNATTVGEKEKIYREFLMEPINKMIEAIIRTYKLYRASCEFVDLHADALSFLITKFDRFKPETGNKSYSYFGTVCKNYLYNEMMKEYKKTIAFTPIDDEIEQDFLKREELLYRIDVHEVDLTDFINKLTDSITEELSALNLTDNEFKVGHALVRILKDWKELFQKPENVKNSPKFNKNLILLYIRNMTGLNTKEIRNAMRRFKTLYGLFKDKYIDD